MINSRRVSDLDPEVQTLAEAFLTACIAAGIDILITSTYRDFESQNALYNQGRSTPGTKVTNARGGQSFHNFKVAFDFVPIVNGKAQWNDPLLFKRVGEIGESVGLEWAGRWIKFKELAHLQYTGGHDLAYFQDGGTL